MPNYWVRKLHCTRNNKKIAFSSFWAINIYVLHPLRDMHWIQDNVSFFKKLFCYNFEKLDFPMINFLTNPSAINDRACYKTLVIKKKENKKAHFYSYFIIFFLQFLFTWQINSWIKFLKSNFYKHIFKVLNVWKYLTLGLIIWVLL